MRLLIFPLLLVLFVGCDGERLQHVAGDGAGGTGGSISAEVPSCERLQQEGLLCHDNWCWLLDGDQGFTLHAVHSPSSFTTYAVGAVGTILQSEGGRWHREESGTVEDLIAVDGLPSGQPWAASVEGTVLRRTAGGWHALPAPGGPIDHLLVTGTDEAWVAASTGLHRWSAGRWRAVASGRWSGLAIDADGIVWATNKDALFRWTGAGLQRVVDTPGRLVARRAATPLLSIGGQLLEWKDGTLHELFTVPGLLMVIRRVIADSDGSLWVFATYDRVGVGYDVMRHLFHWKEGTLREAWHEWHPAFTRPIHAAPRDLAPTARGVLLVGDNGRTIHVTESGADEPSRNGGWIADLFPLAEDEIWALRYGRNHSIDTLRWDGASWSGGPIRSANEGDLTGTGPEDIWAIGDGVLHHWNGTTVELHADHRDWLAVLSLAPNDAWTVGLEGRAAHWNGITWNDVETGTGADLTRLWASGRDDVWAAGETIIHWDGTRWSAPPGLPDGLTRVWSLAGATSTDVWAASNAGLLHWDGAAWSQIDGPHPQGARQVWTAGGDAVFVSSTDGDSYGWYRAEPDGWRKLPFEWPPGVIAGPPRLGIASFGDALARFCR